MLRDLEKVQRKEKEWMKIVCMRVGERGKEREREGERERKERERKREKGGEEGVSIECGRKYEKQNIKREG